MNKKMAVGILTLGISVTNALLSPKDASASCFGCCTLYYGETISVAGSTLSDVDSKCEADYGTYRGGICGSDALEAVFCGGASAASSPWASQPPTQPTPSPTATVAPAQNGQYIAPSNNAWWQNQSNEQAITQSGLGWWQNNSNWK